MNDRIHTPPPPDLLGQLIPLFFQVEELHTSFVRDHCSFVIVVWPLFIVIFLNFENIATIFYDFYNFSIYFVNTYSFENFCSLYCRVHWWWYLMKVISPSQKSIKEKIRYPLTDEKCNNYLLHIKCNRHQGPLRLIKILDSKRSFDKKSGQTKASNITRRFQEGSRNRSIGFSIGVLIIATVIIRVRRFLQITLRKLWEWNVWLTNPRWLTAKVTF